MKKFLAFLLIFFLLSAPVFANIKIVSIFPNPETDAKSNEFIELQNLGCESVDLSEYFLKKQETKNPTPLAGTLAPGESRKFYRANVGLVLKDGDDTISLISKDGEIIDKIQYTKNNAKKGNILTFSHEADKCDSDVEKHDWKNDANNSQNPPNTNDDEKNNSEKDVEDEGNHDENQKNPEEDLPESEEKFSADELFLEDLDEDGFFETMRIVYSDSLTGSLNIEDFSLTSASGADLTPIPNSVFSGTLANDTIILTLTGIITTENIFSMNENSGIFLKSENISNILSIGSKKLEKLNENSFEKYTKVAFSESDSENHHDDSDDISENFPTIFATLQRPITANISENQISCYEKPCKINLDFDPIFSADFPKKDFSCEVHIAGKKFQTCNPPATEITGESDILVKISRKNSKWEIFSIFHVDFDSVNEDSKNPEKPNTKPIKTEKPKISPRSNRTTQYSTPPVISIDSDGKFEHMYEWKTDEEIACFTATCAINLNANDTYSRENKALKYAWKFGEIAEFSRKNPPSVTFTTGKYDIFLTVTDSNGMFAMKQISVTVPEKTDEKIEKNSQKSEWEKSENEEFEAPELVLQNPTKFDVSDPENYVCQTNSDSCSINFSLFGTKKSFSYLWSWDDEEFFESTNPRAKNLGIGQHYLKIRAISRENPNEDLWEHSLGVNIIKIEKPAKKSVTKAKKSTAKSAKSKKTTKKSSKKSPAKKTEKLSKNSSEKTEQKPLPEEKVEVEKNNNTLPLSAAGILMSGVLFAGVRRKF